jgi:phospholipid-transporting ATPase
MTSTEEHKDIQSPPPALVTNEVQPEISHSSPSSGAPVAPVAPVAMASPQGMADKRDSLAARIMKSISSLHLSGDPNGIHTVPFPSSLSNDPKHKHHSTKKSNYIRTTKYTLLTFLPLNLYFQFSRVYNVYFLLGALSTLGGTSSISPASMIVPLLIVLLFSAIKDAYEDYVRVAFVFLLKLNSHT